MNRRVFLQLLALLPFVRILRLPEAARPRATSGQFVFDGVNGLTFPADALPRKIPNAARIVNFRGLLFPERMLEVIK